MAQKQTQLLIKDLCARLPYGFTVHRYSDNRDITFGKNELDEFAHFLEYSEGEKFKPYLRSMESMTEKEENEYRAINCYEGLFPHNADALDYVLSHHLDYLGLIPMGLALEAPEGMYKTK